MSNQDTIDNSVDYQALTEDWDDIFRGKIYSSAGCVEEEEELQNEANEFFTPTRKRKATEINNQTFNTQMFRKAGGITVVYLCGF